MLRVYLADASALKDEALYRRYYDKMPAYRKEKTDRCRFKKDQCLSLGAGALLRLAQRDFGREDLIFTEPVVGEHGKPFFPDSGFFYNLSHSGSAVMCAASDMAPVGCDAELIRGAAGEKIANRFFRDEEKAFIEAAENAESLSRRFFRIWTMKESYIKATGAGMSMPLDSFSVLPAEAGGDTCLRFDVAEYELFEFDYSPLYCCSCCARRGSGTPEFIVKDLKNED